MLMGAKPGEAIPRSCSVCGLGPCANGIETRAPLPASAPDPDCSRQFGCMSHQLCGKTGVCAAKPTKPDSVTPHDVFFAAALGTLIGNMAYREGAELEAAHKGGGITGGQLLLGCAKQWADEAMKVRDSK